MLASIRSCTVVGIDGVVVEVEVDVANGLPLFATVGLPDGAVRESRERVRAAIRNCGYDFPPRKITVSIGLAKMLGVITFIDLIINDIFKTAYNYNLQYDAAVNDHKVVINRWSGVRTGWLENVGEGERRKGEGAPKFQLLMSTCDVGCIPQALPWQCLVIIK
jgi:hypothetical protein